MNIQEVKEIVNLVKNLNHLKRISINFDKEYNTADVDIFGVSTYEDGANILRSLGAQKWEKRLFDEQPPWCTIEATVEGITFKCFCYSLPPTCRVEEVTERIPKRETIDTGEFIEVKRQKIVCTGGEA